MNKIENVLLPIGSVILLKGSTKMLMIISHNVVSEFNSNRVYDYLSCEYPEGFVSKEQCALFNHEQIERVIYFGFDEQKIVNNNEEKVDIESSMQESANDSVMEEVKVETPTTVEVVPVNIPTVDYPTQEVVPTVNVEVPVSENVTDVTDAQSFDFEVPSEGPVVEEVNIEVPTTVETASMNIPTFDYPNQEVVPTVNVEVPVSENVTDVTDAQSFDFEVPSEGPVVEEVNIEVPTTVETASMNIPTVDYPNQEVVPTVNVEVPVSENVTDISDLSGGYFNSNMSLDPSFMSNIENSSFENSGLSEISTLGSNLSTSDLNEASRPSMYQDEINDHILNNNRSVFNENESNVDNFNFFPSNVSNIESNLASSQKDSNSLPNFNFMNDSNSFSGSAPVNEQVGTNQSNFDFNNNADVPDLMAGAVNFVPNNNVENYPKELIDILPKNKFLVDLEEQI